MSRASEEDLQKWLIAGLKGNENAYRLFLEAASRVTRGFLFRRGIGQQDAEDLVQEVLLSLHKARHSFDQESHVLPWLFAIVHYRFADFFRSEKRRPEMNEKAQEAIYHPTADDRLLAEALLAKLPERDQKILRYLKMEEWSVKEISDSIGISESAVKVYAFRAIRSLRLKVGGSSDEN